MPRVRDLLLLTLGATLAHAPAAAAAATTAIHAPFRNFESGPVNALLATPDGQRLLAINTPDHRLEVYRIVPWTAPAAAGAPSVGAAGGPTTPAPGGPTLVHEGSVFTGLEPVAMCLDPADPARLFVANHVSDSVAVVDLATLDVVATLMVGDEPQGLAVAAGRLFVACARAPITPLAPGQVDPGPLLDHVVVVRRAAPPFDPVAAVPVRAWKPRDVCAVGDTVYVIAQNSGNRTTILDENHTKALGLEQEVFDAFDGGPFAVNPVLLHPSLTPTAFARGWYVPNAGRVVFDHEYPGLVPALPDRDVIAIDARSLAVDPTATRAVGTTLFDVEPNPYTGDLWVANTDAHNRTRFEPALRGAAVENRITVVPPGRPASDVLVLDAPAAPRDLPQPAVLAFGAPGGRPLAFAASLQGAAVGVLDARRGDVREVVDTAPVPSGLAFVAGVDLLFVYTRGDHAIRAYDPARSWREVLSTPMPYDPEPEFVRSGRRHLYEARPDEGHGNGRMACATCHVFGHADGLAWDLGDPEGGLAYYYPDTLDGLASYPGQLVVAPTTPVVNPLKGPMVTQSLRGLMDRDEKDDLTLHWRGERRTIHTFQGAFRSLLGGDGISDLAMQELATFLRSIDYAPNPFQRRDRGYAGEQQLGADVYGMNPSFTGKPYKDPGGPACIQCHQGDFFAGDDFTGGRPVASAGSFTQIFQTAQLRMVYEKDFRDLAGFGALHDGAIDGIRGFMDFHIPQGGPPTFGLLSDAEKDAISAFAHAWDHGLSPLVGAQFTLRPDTLAQAAAFLDLAEAEARPPKGNVDLVLKGWRELPGQPRLKRGAHYRLDLATQQWRYQFDTGDVVDRAVLLQVVAAGIAEFTFTCVPPGAGARLGVDRDEDGLFDFQESVLGAMETVADTDGDGYLDGFEVSAGGDPSVPDAALADATAPVIEADRPMEVFHDRATVSFFTDEPATVTVDVGTSLGAADAAHVAVPGARRTHEVLLTALPPGVALHYRITAVDRNGNTATRDGAFQTLPPFVHVTAVTLEASAGPPYTVTAKVAVEDARGQAVTGIPVLGMFAGDLGGAPWQALGSTDAAGVATIAIGPFTPAGPTAVAFSPAYVGSPFPGTTYYVGAGGDTPPVFYDQPANATNYAVISLP